MSIFKRFLTRAMECGVPPSHGFGEANKPPHSRTCCTRVIRVLLLCLVLLMIQASTGCVSGLFYYPTSKEHWKSALISPDIRDVYFESLDGTRLHGWFCPASGLTNETARATVIHFHGNAQNLTTHIAGSYWLTRHGYNVFIFDYRGYGKSEGEISRKGLIQDGAAAIRFVKTLPEVNPERLVVFAQSLGGAVAVPCLARYPDPGVRALVMDSVFYSYINIVRDKIALVPVLAFLKWPLSPLLVSNFHSPSLSLGKLPAGLPVLVVHGTDDIVVPYYHAEKIFKKLREPRRLIRMEGGGHTEAFAGTNAPHRGDLLSFLDGVL